MVYMLQYNNKINKLVILLAHVSVLILFCFSVNAAEAEKAISSSPTAESELPSSINPVNESDTLKKRNSDVLIDGESILDNYGITQSTDFSKSGFLRQDRSTLTTGFTNKILISPSLEYDSNPALSFNRKDPVFIYSLIPELQLGYVDELNRYYLNSALVFQRFSNNTILADREDPNLTIGWDRTYESGSYGVYANYSQFLSRSQEIRTIGTFVANIDGESIQRTRGFGARWKHDLSPRLGLSTNADFRKETFSGGVNLANSSLLDLATRLNYEYTEKLNTYVQLGYSDLRPESFADTDIRRLGVGAVYAFSPQFEGAFRASKYKTSGAQSDNDWEVGALFTYNINRTGYVAELTRELAPAGGIGFLKSDTIRLGWTYNLSEQDRLIAGYSINKTKSDAGFPEQEFRELNAEYNRTFWGNWDGRARLSYREVLASGSPDADGVLIGIYLIHRGLSF